MSAPANVRRRGSDDVGIPAAASAGKAKRTNTTMSGGSDYKKEIMSPLLLFGGGLVVFGVVIFGAFAMLSSSSASSTGNAVDPAAPAALTAKAGEYVGFPSPFSAKTNEMRVNKMPSYDGPMIAVEDLAAHSADAVEGDAAGRLWLAILGEVFDVTAGRKYYAKERGYDFFTGVDGSRGFVTGEFMLPNLTRTVADFEPHQMLGLADWVDFYHETYIYLGRVAGFYYDAQGEPTEVHTVLAERLERGFSDKQAEQDLRQTFPHCNMKKGKVWCTPRSGGIARDWSGVPRKFKSQSAREERCACVQPASLDDPRLRPYDGCAPDTDFCLLPVADKKEE